MANILEKAEKFIDNNNPLDSNDISNFRSNGFLLPSRYSSDGTGLAYSKVPPNREAQLKRNIISWFVPEFGIVKMYINPNQIRYTHQKLINSEKTKGGYTLQYWGEELTTLAISGTTGSSGVEGINMLYEIYRAEQNAFDTSGLLIAANNSANNLASDLVGGLFGSVFGDTVGDIAGGIGGILAGGAGGPSLGGAENYPTLASMAFGVEMYYGGWVYRGYFTRMSFTESADNFLWSYDIDFTVTQKRGYRGNYLPWHRKPTGPSSYFTANPTPKDLESVSFSGVIK